MAYLNALLPKDQDLDAQLPVENQWANIMQKYSEEHVPPEGAAAAASCNNSNATTAASPAATTTTTTTSTVIATSITSSTSVTTSAINITAMTSTPPPPPGSTLISDSLTMIDRYDFCQMSVDSSGDSEAIDNPYLRAVKPPRKKKR